MAGFSTGLLGFQQSADDYYKNLANDAMMQGQQAETDRQNAQQYAQLAASLPLYDPTNLDYARQLVAAKVGYEQAADAAEQARHHENAEIVRREAAKNGIDLSRFDATNVNANQANTNLSMMLNEARRDFMNRETPDELYTRRKNELMRDGLNEERAMEQAGREYQEYSARYRHAGRNLFYDQGTTENAINNLGAYVLTGLGDPQTAQMFASLYAHPVDDYKKNWAIEQAYLANQLASNRDILRNSLGIQAANNAFNNQRVLSNDRFAQTLALNQQKTDLQKSFAEWAQDLDMNKRNQLVQMAMDNPEFAALIFGSKASKGGTSSGKELSSQDKTTAGSAGELAVKFLQGGMNEQEYLAERAKLAPKLDEDSMQFMEKIRYLYNFIREYERNPNGENTIQYLRAVKGDPDLVEFLESNGLSQYAAAIK